MKRTGSEMPSADGSPSEGAQSVETIDRARLQADVAQQRVRLAKEELHRARKRLKEAKREAKRARKQASLARKDWKRARRHAKTDDPSEGRAAVAVVAKNPRKLKIKSVASRARRPAGRRTNKRTARSTRKAKSAAQ
jgi:hypothetical protein